jgi:hypothetical protein
MGRQLQDHKCQNNQNNRQAEAEHGSLSRGLRGRTRNREEECKMKKM